MMCLVINKFQTDWNQTLPLVEGLCESLFIIINTFVEIAIQHPYQGVMFLHEHLYNKQDLHLSYTNCTESVLWDGMREAITRTNEGFFQWAF